MKHMCFLIFVFSIALFLAPDGFTVILSHVVSSCFNVCPFLATWINFRQCFMSIINMVATCCPVIDWNGTLKRELFQEFGLWLFDVSQKICLPRVVSQGSDRSGPRVPFLFSYAELLSCLSLGWLFSAENANTFFTYLSHKKVHFREAFSGLLAQAFPVSWFPNKLYTFCLASRTLARR